MGSFVFLDQFPYPVHERRLWVIHIVADLLALRLEQLPKMVVVVERPTRRQLRLGQRVLSFTCTHCYSPGLFTMGHDVPNVNPSRSSTSLHGGVRGAHSQSSKPGATPIHGGRERAGTKIHRNPGC